MSAARVLVVDDDPWILRMVTATLEKRHYVVDTARDGQQALQRARTVRPDVIITDLMMPVMDGWAFVQQLRTVAHLSSVPVIFLTALGKDEHRLRSLGINPQEYLSKPFRFDELERRVVAALSGEREDVAPPPNQAPHAPAHQPVPQGYSPYGPPQPQANPYPPPYPGGYPAPAYAPYPGPYPGGYPPPAGPPGYPAHPSPPAGPSAPPAATTVVNEPSAASSGSLGSLDESSLDGIRRGRSTALNGRLEQLGLSSLLVMMEMERKDGVLTLKGGNEGEVGRIFIRKGQVIHAKLDRDQEIGGRDSVYEMLSWQKGTFSFAAMEVDMEDTVQSSTTHLLMEGARLIDESKRDEF